MYNPISHEQLYADYGLILTIAQIITILGILGFGIMETYMSYRFFSSHIEQSSGLAMVWIRFVLYPVFALIVAVVLQLMKGLWK
ncbi:hypothetical protein B1526_1473 [Bifidobacterium criceti]|uniref:Uncharacterized protein n=1 Tax=Bifidobacterium criceti TaxID=1960969 RepID=A0A2A2ED82_9BIFI|nr:hypothetical protein B1526_1473 [Bifidobacterium criceti]